MRNWCFAIVLLIACVSQAQVVDIPDPAFKNMLVNFNCVDTNGDGVPDSNVDSNGDGEIQVSEAEAAGNLTLNISGVSDFEGIQSFINIEVFDGDNYCQNMYGETLDLSQNMLLKYINVTCFNMASIVLPSNGLLEYIDCESNELEELDVSQYPNLEYLECTDNNLDELDVSNNLNLTKIYIYHNNISTIDVTQNVELERLGVGWNPIATIDISQNVNLTGFFCYYSQISELDLTTNLELIDISTAYCPITTMDFSQHNNLEFIDVQGNNLDYLNIRNGNNHNLIRVYADENPNLDCILVDDADYANSHECIITFPYDDIGWCKDDHTTYSEDCILGVNDLQTTNFHWYPNPTHGGLSLANPNQTEIETIEIHDIQGKLVLQKEDDLHQINMSHLTAGLYFIHIKTTTNTVIQRIIKQ